MITLRCGAVVFGSADNDPPGVSLRLRTPAGFTPHPEHPHGRADSAGPDGGVRGDDSAGAVGAGAGEAGQRGSE